MQSDAVYPYTPSVWPLDVNTHVAEGAKGRETIGSFEKAGNLRHPIGNGAEHYPPMRNGLVPGYPDTTG